MKKIKKIVLSVLLFTFAFILVHDYVMVDEQMNGGYEISHFQCEDTAIDLTLHLHDSIHSLLFEPILKSHSLAIKPPYQKQFELQEIFISFIGSVPQRPPLS